MINERDLAAEIEAARKKLDEALGRGEDAESYYALSLELDRLLEEYIDLDKKSIPQ